MMGKNVFHRALRGRIRRPKPTSSEATKQYRDVDRIRDLPVVSLRPARGPGDPGAIVRLIVSGHARADYGDAAVEFGTVSAGGVLKHVYVAQFEVAGRETRAWH